MTVKNWLFLMALAAAMLVALVLSWPLYYYALLRLVVMVSAGILLTIIGINAVNAGTTGDWLPWDWKDELPKAIVIGALILGCLYLASTG